MSALPRPAWWRGRRVGVTGHTGFVGGWLCAWLADLGAEVSGYALPPAEGPGFYSLYDLPARLARSVYGDVRDAGGVSGFVSAARPSVVFHLAAQPIVRDAYRDPVGTFATNVMGTVNVLQACRETEALERLVVFTTDKVYRNDQSGRPMVEGDRLGGNEPYSASKAGAEWATASWWETFLRRAPSPPGVAIVRAGNIVGGGDWSPDRLVPDAIRAFSQGSELVLRSPQATRPWQHVLDAVRATLLVAERGSDAGDPAESLAWNFGPRAGEMHTVAEVAGLAAGAWGPSARWRAAPDESIPESRALALSSARAASALGWSACWNLQRTIAESVSWYREALGGARMREPTSRQIEGHCADVAAA